MKVGESSDLQDLHLELVDELDGYIETLSDRYDGPAYTPHLTLADKLAPDDLAEARQILMDCRLRRRFTVEQIHLLRGRGRWDITRSFALGTA